MGLLLWEGVFYGCVVDLFQPFLALCAPCRKTQISASLKIVGSMATLKVCRVLCVSWLCMQSFWSEITKGDSSLCEKEKVKKHSVDITLMVSSWSVRFHYVVAILIFSSSLTKTKSVWVFFFGQQITLRLAKWNSVSTAWLNIWKSLRSFKGFVLLNMYKFKQKDAFWLIS